MQYALAKEYEQSIREKRQRHLQEIQNKAQMEKNQVDIGTRLGMMDGVTEQQKLQMQREQYNGMNGSDNDVGSNLSKYADLQKVSECTCFSIIIILIKESNCSITSLLFLHTITMIV